MIVLGFDTSTASTAVAVRLHDGRTTEARDDPPAGTHPGHATRLLGMAHELLSAAGVDWSAIDRIAVGVGPGTFTGLRVGVATARGLAQSLPAELVGISSTGALAAVALADDSRAGGALPDDALAAKVSTGNGRAAVLSVIDARRGEAFAAAYELGEDGLAHELAPPRAVRPEELAGVTLEAERYARGEPLGWLAVGDGALRYRGALEAAGIEVAPEGSPLHLLSAGRVCELGAAAALTGLGEIVPDYRRRPDAELALEGAGSAGSVLR
jgi:tRNA threonylcarbamoyladenosine biosynthesis protein TsaB